MRQKVRFAIAVALLSASVACAAEPDAAARHPIVAADLLEHVQTATEILLADGGNVEEFSVIVAEHVLWPDGAIGCPRPGMMYTQAVVEGYRIVIATPDGEVHFHGETSRSPARCDTPTAPVR